MQIKYSDQKKNNNSTPVWYTVNNKQKPNSKSC